MSDHTTRPTPQTIPYGYCHCGCGQKTTTATHTNRARGCVKGQPNKFLSGHSARCRRHATIHDAFFSYFTPGAPDQCWEWTGPTDKSRGYGRFTVNRVVYAAHRISYEIHHGPLEPDHFACHTCDNPLCVNPYHLFSGSGRDNVDDMVQKRRHAYGSTNGNAILREAQARQIRQMYASGEYTYVRLARLFGVSKTLVGRIVRREMWRHV